MIAKVILAISMLKTMITILFQENDDDNGDNDDNDNHDHDNDDNVDDLYIYTCIIKNNTISRNILL